MCAPVVRSHYPAHTDMLCAVDPKEAITFLEKTKEKVSLQTVQKFLFEGQMLYRYGD